MLEVCTRDQCEILFSGKCKVVFKRLGTDSLAAAVRSLSRLEVIGGMLKIRKTTCHLGIGRVLMVRRRGLWINPCKHRIMGQAFISVTLCLPTVAV